MFAGHFPVSGKTGVVYANKINVFQDILNVSMLRFNRTH